MIKYKLLAVALFLLLIGFCGCENINKNTQEGESEMKVSYDENRDNLEFMMKNYGFVRSIPNNSSSSKP